MSLAHPQAGTSKSLELSVPSPGGWTLLEAADALCPQEAQLFREGGEQLKAAVRADFGEWAALLHDDHDEVTVREAEYWLQRRLLAALRLRPDLQLTGYDLTQGVHARRFQMPYALLLLSDPERHRVDSNYIYIDLFFAADTVQISYSFSEMRPSLPNDEELSGARIEAANAAAAGTNLPARSKPRVGAATVMIPQPTLDEIARWQTSRYDTWPAGRPAPTASDCLAAAKAHFRCHIARDPFMRIRKTVVPWEWQKPGPRPPEDLGRKIVLKLQKKKAF